MRKRQATRAALSLLCLIQISPGCATTQPPAVTLQAFVPRGGSLVRQQGNQKISCADPAAAQFVCFDFTDFNLMLETYLQRCESWQ